MKLLFPEVTGALCAKMDRGLSGQDAVNGMVLVFDTSRNSESVNILRGGVASTLMARDYKSGSDCVVYPGVAITSPQNSSNPQPGSPSCGLTNDSRYYLVKEGQPPRKYIVRRLTPLECCRLQGFPDWWTDGVEGSDSAQYKMWGNGIALPCAVDVLGRIARAVKEETQ